jgi:hypothetical protein
LKSGVREPAGVVRTKAPADLEEHGVKAMSDVAYIPAPAGVKHLIGAASFKRALWLEAVVEALRAKFAAVNYTIPAAVRTSIGWPRRGSSCTTIGECWPVTASSDGHSEIFISPKLTDSTEIVGTLAHELTHAVVGTAAKHGPIFKACAHAIGLTGPMRSTVASPEFTTWAGALLEQIGKYPAGSLTDIRGQTTRQLRCECLSCGYLARVSNRWLSDAGPPICPVDFAPMSQTKNA